MKTLSSSALQFILKINRCKLKHKEIFYNGFGDYAIVPVTFCWGRHARPQGVLAEIVDIFLPIESFKHRLKFLKCNPVEINHKNRFCGYIWSIAVILRFSLGWGLIQLEMGLVGRLESDRVSVKTYIHLNSV